MTDTHGRSRGTGGSCLTVLSRQTLERKETPMKSTFPGPSAAPHPPVSPSSTPANSLPQINGTSECPPLVSNQKPAPVGQVQVPAWCARGWVSVYASVSPLRANCTELLGELSLRGCLSGGPGDFKVFWPLCFLPAGQSCCDPRDGTLGRPDPQNSCRPGSRETRRGCVCKGAGNNSHLPSGRGHQAAPSRQLCQPRPRREEKMRCL